MAESKKIKPEIQRFTQTRKADALILQWRAWPIFIFTLIGLIILNTLFIVNAVNEKNLPMWFIKDAAVVSAILVLFSWLTTYHRLVITPKVLKYRGGWRSFMGRTMAWSAINTIYLKTKVNTGEADSENEYFVMAELKNKRRVRLSNALFKKDAEFLRTHLKQFAGSQLVMRGKPPDRFMKFLERNPFPLSLVLALVLGITGWATHYSELGDKEASPSTRMVMGWAGYFVSVGFCIYFNKSATHKASSGQVVVFTLFSFVAACIIFWLIFW